MAIEYHVLILDYHKYVRTPTPHIREEVVRDPRRIYNFESGMQTVLGAYVVDTKDDQVDWRLKKLNEYLDKILGK